MKKVLLVATTASMIDQFNTSNIIILQNLGYEVSIACNFDKGNTTSSMRITKFKKELNKQKISIYNLPFPRSPFDLYHLLISFKHLKKIIAEKQFDLIHCHTPVGGLVTRLICIPLKKTRNLRIIYTAHGFHFYKGAPVKNWILYYPIEFFLSKYTDDLILINKEDYTLASLKFHAANIHYIPGVGVNTDLYKRKSDLSELYKLQYDLGIYNFKTKIICVGELINRKNHKTALLSFAKSNLPSSCLIICGQGVLDDSLQKLAKDLGIAEKVFFLGYRNDINKLLQSSNCFLFPSLQEGLSVSLMEAMAAGLPIIASNIRGNTDLIVDGKNGLLLSPLDIDGFSNALKRLASDYELACKFSANNLIKIQYFDVRNINHMMQTIYNMSRD